MQGLGEGSGRRLIHMRSGRAGASPALPGALLACCLGTLVFLWGCSPPSQPFNATEVSGIDYGRGLKIADTAGQLRSLEDFDDRVTIVFFGFTMCPDVCPNTLLRLKQVRNSLGEAAERVQVIVVSVDPERDTPERLAAYVNNFDASFIGLRPEPQQLEAVIKAFYAIAVKVPSKDGSSYTIDHSATLYVYDRSNRLRLITQPDFRLDAFADDLRRLVAEG